MAIAPMQRLASMPTSATDAKETTRQVRANAPLDEHLPFTPIDLARLELELSTHPDKGWSSRLLQYLRHGAIIGYKGQRTTRTTPNLQSAALHPEVIDQMLLRECARGHIAGPFPAPPCDNLQSSGVGVVPKKDGSWRMIMHLSAPPSSSINDGIDKEQFSLRYSSLDDATKLIASIGQGAYLTKIDLKNTFRLVPVAKQDWQLLGIHWRGKYYVDKQLPFGLRSAPFLFNELATALHWILQTNYCIGPIIHYLDDYLLIAPTMAACQQAKTAMLSLCADLRIPLSWEKVEGPSTSLSFLGIEIDTVAWVLRLPPTKLEALLAELHHWHTRSKCTKRQLLSLIGKLSFATKVIPAGRIFLRRLITLSTAVGPLNHHIDLNTDAKADIHWWIAFLPSWNGSHPILEPTWTPSTTLQLFTDASSLHGFGAYFQGAWIRDAWSPTQHLNTTTGISIAWQELYAVVMAALTWGKFWSGRRILAHCDNKTVVDVWHSYSSKSSTIMGLVRKLHFIAARNNFHIRISHIQGTNNSIADALSRNQMTTFYRLAPQADAIMTPIPPLASIP